MSSPAALSKKGDRLYDKKKYAKAIECFQQVLAQEPNNAHAHKKLAYCYYYVKQIDPLIFHGKKSLELNPDQPSLEDWLSQMIVWAKKQGMIKDEA